MGKERESIKAAHPKSNKLVETRDILMVWRLIVKNLWLIVLLPILLYGIGFIYAYRMNNIYQCSAQLLLKSNETYDYQDPIYKGLGAYGVYMDVQNQMRIVRSRDLIGEVVDKLNMKTSYYVVGKLKKVEVFETLPFRSELEVYNEVFYELPIGVEILGSEKYRIFYEYKGQDVSIEGLFDVPLETENFRLVLLKNYVFREDMIDVLMGTKYELVFHSRNFLINRHQSAISVNNIENTSILELSVQDQLEKRAEVFLDTLVATYVDYSKRIQLEVNQNTLDNIERQIDTVVVFIEQLENQLLSYKSANSILDVDKEESEFFSEYVDYSKQKRLLERKNASIDALEGYLETSKDNRILPPTFYIEKDDYYLSETVNKLRTKQVDLELSKAQLTEKSFNVTKLNKEISVLKNDILKYLENLRTAIQDEIDVTNQIISSFRGQVLSIPKSAQDISNIQRELDVNNRMYVFLLEKKTNTLIARAGIIPQVRIIEDTTSMGIVEPDKKKIVRLFVLAGVILAFLIAVVRKLFFEKVENLAELSEVTNLTIAGGVSQLKTSERLIVVRDKPKSQYAENFRSIRTNLAYLGQNKNDKKRILVSSFFPGEGKTFCSTNLSTLYARGNKKVLLIDFDLHRPKVHSAFKLENIKGVSNFIIGQAKFEEIVQKNVDENLDIITAGPIAPNPSELILRENVRNLLDKADEVYDIVMVDTPPFGLLNDTFELIKNVDVFVVIMNTKFTRSRGVKRIEESLSRFDDVDIALVLNGIKQSKFSYYYSKYTYKYGYNYGYGYGYGSGYGYGYGYDSGYISDDSVSEEEDDSNLNA